ncbi:hypothetical protein, partial [Bordetella pertussis]|uniref:hypothetical protein n=1 Tax=Bordetella pertussis TaxID=520 RepID=UPI0030C99DB5
NQAGRRVRDTVEVLTGLDFDEAIEEPIHNLKNEIIDRLRSDILATLDTRYADPEVSLTPRINVEITDLRYIVAEQQFKMAGTYDAEVS